MFGTICKVSQNKSFINKFGGKLSKKIEKATIFVTFDVVVSDTSDGQSDLQKSSFQSTSNKYGIERHKFSLSGCFLRASNIYLTVLKRASRARSCRQGNENEW